VIGFLRALRALVLGETWVLPLAVAVVVGAAAILREAAPSLWHDAGGPLLGAAVAVALVATVALTARR
jgi:hypothetical protein